ADRDNVSTQDGASAHHERPTRPGHRRVASVSGLMPPRSSLSGHFVRSEGSDACPVGAAARLGLEFGLALEFLTLRAAELSSGFHLAVALDVSTLHAEALPIAVRPGSPSRCSC